MLTATSNGAFDQAKVQALATQQSQLMSQMMVQRLRSAARSTTGPDLGSKGQGRPVAAGPARSHQSARPEAAGLRVGDRQPSNGSLQVRLSTRGRAKAVRRNGPLLLLLALRFRYALFVLQTSDPKPLADFGTSVWSPPCLPVLRFGRCCFGCATPTSERRIAIASRDPTSPPTQAPPQCPSSPRCRT